MVSPDTIASHTDNGNPLEWSLKPRPETSRSGSIPEGPCLRKKKASGSKRCEATPLPIPKTDGDAPRAFAIQRKSTAHPPAYILSQSSSGSTGHHRSISPSSTSQNLCYQAFPIPPKGGLCVVKLLFPELTSFETMSPQPILPMRSRWPEEASLISRSANGSSPKGPSGTTIAEKKERLVISSAPFQPQTRGVSGVPDELSQRFSQGSHACRLPLHFFAFSSRVRLNVGKTALSFS
jgi:hypothetical protein